VGRTKTKGRRAESVEDLCARCDGKCCRYFALPISEPDSWEEFDDIRWYLAHQKTAVFVDEGTWYLLVENRCQYLNRQNRCDIYPDRPAICRRYGRGDCEFKDGDAVYDVYFDTPEQIWEYAEAVLGPRRKRKAAGTP